MSRTTLDLEASVLAELRERGRRERKSMGVVASELLAGALATSAPTPTHGPLRWITGELGVPSVNLEDKEAVRRALDAR